MMVKKGNLPYPDVLVFFGRRELANDLVAFLRSLGCDASTLNELPANGLGVDQKIEYYVRGTRFIVAIATQDLPVKGRRRDGYPANTLVNELTISLRLRRSDTIILLEKGTQYPSTLGRPTWEEFPPAAFQKVLPALVSTLVKRGLISVSTRYLTSRSHRANPVSAFIKQMDLLWRCSDQAWGHVFKAHHQETEAAIAVQLDNFFVAYHSGLTRTFASPLDDKNLAGHLVENLADAKQHIGTILSDVLRWKAAVVLDEETKLKEENHVARKLRQILNDARTAHDHFLRVKDFDTKKQEFERALSLYDKFLDQAT